MENTWENANYQNRDGETKQAACKLSEQAELLCELTLLAMIGRLWVLDIV